MSITKLVLGSGLALAVLCGTAAYATPIDVPAPGAVLDLNGQPIPTAYTPYQAVFTATQTTSNITFGFRDDPAFIYLDWSGVVWDQDPATNLLSNGSFEGGTWTSGGNTLAPVGWTYANPYNIADTWGVDCYTAPARNGSCQWLDGAHGSYDYITQAISTVIGHRYAIRFWAYADNSADGNGEGPANWQQTGNNATDLLVYAGAVPDFASVPEPAGLGLFGVGVLLIGCVSVLRKRCA